MARHRQDGFTLANYDEVAPPLIEVMKRQPEGAAPSPVAIDSEVAGTSRPPPPLLFGRALRRIRRGRT